MTIANGNSQFTAYVTKLELVGRPLLSDQPSKYECEDERTSNNSITNTTGGAPGLSTTRMCSAIGRRNRLAISCCSGSETRFAVCR